MATYVTDLLDWLAATGHVDGATGWDGFAYRQPATHSDTVTARSVTLYPTPGEPRDVRPEMLRSGLQVRVRAEKGGESVAHAKCAALRDALCAISAQDVGATNIRFVLCEQSEPLPLGPDAAGRPEFTLNFIVARGG